MTRDYSPPITIRPADQISSALLIYNTRHLPLCPLNILHFSKVQMLTNCTEEKSRDAVSQLNKTFKQFRLSLTKILTCCCSSCTV